MFGLLNEAEEHDSLEPTHYELRRGRFYLIWNASKTSGRPMLIALMAGHAAHSVEETDTNSLLDEITEKLRKVFSSKVPMPREVIVTRWKQDKFTKGTYSYVGPYTKPGDYELMAQPVGNLHFAGEATCGTHPATVHGAFLSGLRVASDVMERMAGPLTLPSPLVGASAIKQEIPATYAIPLIPAVQHPTVAAPVVEPPASVPTVSDPTPEPVIKLESDPDTIRLAYVPVAQISTPVPTPAPAPAPAPVAKKAAAPPRKSVCSTDQSFWARSSFDSFDLNYEASIIGHILGKIGERPEKPTRPGVNPFLLYTRDKWDEVKARCSAEQAKSGKPELSGKNIIRTTIGTQWRTLSDSEKEPYQVQSQLAQEQADAVRKDWEQKVVQWDEDAIRLRNEHIRDHPPTDSEYGRTAGSQLFGGGAGMSKRKTNVSNCVALDVSAL